MVLKGFLVALSMFSIIPVKNIEWDKDSMKYMMCFLPFVGLIIGIAIFAWYRLAIYASFSPIFFAAVSVALPIVISGGLHMDGFIDTADAISSRQSMERKLKILKDSHVGAFGVLFCAVLLVIAFGIWGELYLLGGDVMLAACTVFILSRIAGAVMLVISRNATKSGLANTFLDRADRTVFNRAIIAIIVIYGVLLFIISVKVALIFILVAVLLFIALRSFFYSEFGGITGDLIGFSITLYEVALLFVIAILGALGWV